MQTLNQTYQDIPIYKNGHQLSIPALKKMYGMQAGSFAKLAKINLSQVREGDPTPTVRNKVKFLEKIVNLLWKITEGSKSETKGWLHKPADEYLGLTPIEFMQLDANNDKVVFHNLQQAVYGEVMGA